MNRPAPKVSVLLPNLNNRPFLEERVRTIEGQTLGDWELVVVDNHSDDGAWEFFLARAARDPRWRASQAPRRGMYANWNNCVRLARGEYVYIATSDDTMSPDCLERLAAALDEHPECDLAHCKLSIIDENGNPHPDLRWDRFSCAAYFGDWIDRGHIRLAPHDGILHCGVKTVYTSITQLMIRRRLFERIGLFRTDFGSLADFEWEMRASLVAHTVHVPAVLATWRVHRSQETDLRFLETSLYRKRLLQMIGHALKAAAPLMPRALTRSQKRALREFLLKERLRLELKEQRRRSGKCLVATRWLAESFRTLWAYLSARRAKRAFVSPQEGLQFSRRIIADFGLRDNLRPLETAEAGGTGEREGLSECGEASRAEGRSI